MIEINLIPDVKQELLKAQSVRSTVVSLSGIISVGAIGIVVLLGLYTFGAQLVAEQLADNSIVDQNKKLQSNKDLNQVLTIQNSLAKIQDSHDAKYTTSRLLGMLTAIIPPAPNSVAISKVVLNTDSNMIMMDAQTDGFSSFEVFKKTLEATKLNYKVNGSLESVSLASSINDSSRSYGENSSGTKVLTFTVSFVYPQELFGPHSENATVAGPTKTNVTDSFTGLPTDLFTNRAAPLKEEGR